MPDRTYAIAIAVILVICCLGMYVAVSGYLNANVLVPPSASTLAAPATVVVVVSTAVPSVTKPGATVSTAATAAPAPSPLGVFQTITASTSSSVPVAGISPAPTQRVATAPAAATPVAGPVTSQSCAGFAYCPVGGPPDKTLGIGGNDCPRNYIWGQVLDAGGKGQANVTIRFKSPNNETGQAVSKSPPDPPGKYDILAAGGKFSVWISDSAGRQLSPPVTVESMQAYSGSGNCPTRIDFKAQK